MASHHLTKHHLGPYERLNPSRIREHFHGKSVLITGGGYGIGASIARSFAKAGVRSIIVCGRSEEPLKEVVAALNKSFDEIDISYNIVDIASPASVSRLFARVVHPVDILINNAGFLPAPTNFLDADLGGWWQGFEINVYGTILVTQAFLRSRRHVHAADPATVVTLNTIGAYSVRVPELSAYGASKAALARAMELIAVDVPEDVARLITIHPGAVKTAMGKKSGLEGAFPATDVQLSAEFVVWAASAEARFLGGRFAWVNWDIDELVSMKEKIIEEDLFRTALKGA
jgi:NAD(P)-dependent dehydrogenase (short-subunit alcohol dehydrogenase family)